MCMFITFKMNTQEIMAELDEHKQNIPENLYIQLANLLKEKYNTESTIPVLNTNNEEQSGENEDRSEYEEESDEEEVTNENIDRRIVECVKIIYRPEFEKICMKYINLPFRNYYILIENNNYDEYEDDMHSVKEILTHYVLDSLSKEAFEEIIESEGGIATAYERVNVYREMRNKLPHLSDEEYIKRLESLPEMHKLCIMTYHIMDHHIYEYEYVPEENIPVLLEDDAVELRTFLKTLSGTFTMYVRNKQHLSYPMIM